MKVYSNLMNNNSKINASVIAYKDSDNNIDTLDNILSNKSYKQQSFSNVSCSADTQTTLVTLTLPKGIWVVTGNFNYSSISLRYYLTLHSGSAQVCAMSAYDNAGAVGGGITNIIVLTQETNITMRIWPNSKTVSLSGTLKAVKYL
ncbi:MAG: hypothetical protein IJI58_05090 [Bacilli bacterium]|nr:hypothetical protein [Bacilli bacterium]